MPNAYERRRVAELAEGNARAAKTIDCQRCGQRVIRGDDDDKCSITVTVDPDDLTPVEEMLALFDGRYTCTLERMRDKNARPNSHALWHREPAHIHSTKPRRGTVHAEHICKAEDIERARHGNNPVPALW